MVRINFQTREKNGCKCNAGIGELSEFFLFILTFFFLSFFHKKFLCFTFYVKKKKKKYYLSNFSSSIVAPPPPLKKNKSSLPLLNLNLSSRETKCIKIYFLIKQIYLYISYIYERTNSLLFIIFNYNFYIIRKFFFSPNSIISTF